MTWRTTEALTTVRQAADDPRAIEGIALPYNVQSGLTNLDGRGTVGREVHFPASAKASVEYWMSRQDGARLPYRPRHGERPIGAVQTLQDTPDGVAFRAQILPGPAGDAYLAEVAAGINGVSVEFGPGSVPPSRMRDGTVVQRDIKLQGLAGSDTPAYDGARIAVALRDLEDEIPPPEPTRPSRVAVNDGIAGLPTAGSNPMDPETQTTPAEPGERDAATSAVEPIAPAERSALERNDPVVQAIARSPIVISRAEAVYSPTSGHSFLRDLQASHQGDSAASERQARHNSHLTDIAVQIERAGDVLSSEIPGALPNDYLPGLLTPRILKGRPMGGFYQRTPISDARPKIFAKVTTSSSVAVQSAEGAALSATDVATTAVTATPLMYGAYLDVSRQVIDGADPSAQSMILQDLIEAYAQASETVIKTAVEAGASASGSAITAATPYAGLQANVVAYQAARFLPATGQFVPPALYTVALAQADTTGRPFFTFINPSNSQATVEAGGAQGNILGAGEYLSWASTVNVVVTGRPSDYVIYESSVAQFSYDQVVGPQAVRLGIWAYLVVGTRLGSLKVTAA